MFLLDRAGNITFWSAGAESIVGWSEAEALGQSGVLVFTAEERERGDFEAEVEQARKDGQAVDRRWHL